MEKNFKHMSHSDFKVGDLVETKSGILGKVVCIVSQRYVKVQDRDGKIYVAIPAHGDLRKV